MKTTKYLKGLSNKTLERASRAYRSLDESLDDCPLLVPGVRLHHIIIGNLASLGVLGAAYAIYSYFSK